MLLYSFMRRVVSVVSDSPFHGSFEPFLKWFGATHEPQSSTLCLSGLSGLSGLSVSVTTDKVGKPIFIRYIKTNIEIYKII